MRHSKASRGIRTVIDRKKKDISGYELLEVIYGNPGYLPHLTDDGLRNLQGALIRMRGFRTLAASRASDDKMLEQVRKEMERRNMRDPEQDRYDDLLDEAIEAMYDAGETEIAHDVERGNLDKAWNEISKTLSLAEKRRAKQPFDAVFIARLRTAKKALKAIP